MLVDELDLVLDGWADDNHLVRVHEGARWVELAIRVAPTCCETQSDPGPGWDWLDHVDGRGWVVKGSWDAACRGCGQWSQNWVHVGVRVGEQFDPEQIVELKESVEYDASKLRTRLRSDVYESLKRQLTAAVEEAQAMVLDDPIDLPGWPDVNSMNEPGVGMEGLSLVAWGYDPTGNGDILEVRAALSPR